MDYGRLRGRTHYGRFGMKEKDVFDSEGKKLKSSDIGLYPKLTSLFKRGFGLKYVAKPIDQDAKPKTKDVETIKGQFATATYDHFVRATTIESDRLKSFEDFMSMEFTPEISSALDIYADECLTKNENGHIITITSENNRVKLILENLFIDILDVEHNLWYWIRNMCKYGNHYLLLDVQPERGIVGFLPLPVTDIRRVEAYDGNINSVKFIWDAQNLEFDSWQISHFRMLDKMEKYPYGTSCLESARLIWKSLCLVEDAMLIYRTTRSPDRRIFYIDVGNIDPKDVRSYIQEIKDQVKRIPQVDSSTGNINKKYNVMPVDEDFFIPVRGDKSSKIETLSGPSNMNDIADIEYMQGKLFAALKVPKAYLTFEEQLSSKATLSTEDFRFARTINRVQQAAIATLTNIAITHLWTLGFRDKEHLTGFEIELTNPSIQSEKEKMELLTEKTNLFTSMWNESTLTPVSYVWAMENIYGFSEDEIKAILNQQFLEGKVKLQIEKASGLSMDDAGMDVQADFESDEESPTEEPSNKNANKEIAKVGLTNERIENMIKSAKYIRELKNKNNKREINNEKRMIVNSLTYDGVIDMLESLDEKLDNKKETNILFNNQSI